MTARRQRPEQAIQRAIFQHLRQRSAPGVFAFHVPNGGARTAIEAAIFKGLGVVPGTPDVIAIKGGVTHALELKAPGGRLSDAQRDCHERLRAAGAIVGTATGLDEALWWLEYHSLLRGRAQRPGAADGWQRFRQELAAAPTRDAATDVFHDNAILFSGLSSAERERRYAEVEGIIAEKPTEDSPCQGRASAPASSGNHTEGN
jgi:hypothetical protein